MYNIKHYTCTDSYSFTHDNTLARLLNLLIKGINENQSMPRHILVFVDHEFLFMLNKDNQESGTSLKIGKALHWLVNRMTKEIEDKKKALSFFKPGAITPLEPKFIWVKMLEMSNTSKAMAMMKTKFNIVLEQILRQTGSGFLLQPFPNDRQIRPWFDRGGNMMHDGRIAYWKILDANIRRFDVEKTGLDPLRRHELGDGTQRQNQERRFQLPRPPMQSHMHKPGFNRKKENY